MTAEQRITNIMEDNMSEILDAHGHPAENAVTNPDTGDDVSTEEADSELEDSPTEQPLPEMDCAYIVGVKPDGGFVFEVLGDNPGLVQLLGLHKYAEHRLEVAKDINQGYGPALLSQQLGQVGQMLKVMLNMLTQQSKDNLLK
jgi:hypothetical protein